MTCTCQGCGCQYTVDFNVSNETWMRIVPCSNSGGLLCAVCIARKIEQANGYKSYVVVDLYWLMERFNSIVNGKGLSVSRIAVKCAIDDVIGGRV